jgi:hypothetical protein
LAENVHATSTSMFDGSFEPMPTIFIQFSILHEKYSHGYQCEGTHPIISDAILNRKPANPK